MDRDRTLAAAAMRGLATLAGSRGVVLALQFVTIAVLAAHLGPADLGVYTFALAVVGIFRLIPNFGLVPVLTREIAQVPEREPVLVPNVLYLRVVLGVTAYGLLAATVIVGGFDADSRDAALIAGLALLVVVDALRAVLEVRLRLGWVSVAELVEAAAGLGGAILLARADAGTAAFVWLWTALKLLNGCILATAALRMGRFRWRPRAHTWAPVVRAALPLGLAGVLMALYHRLDLVLLAAFKPPADVGQYGAAFRFLDAANVLPVVVMSVLSPVLSRSVVEGAAVLRRRYARALEVLVAVALLIGIAGAFCAWRLLPRLPGFAEFDGAGVALSILAPAAALILLGTVVQGALISGHLQGLLLRIAALGLAVNLALNAVLIPTASYVGAAVATTATELVMLTLSMRAARAKLGVAHATERTWRLLLAGLVLAAALAAGLAWDPWLQLAAGVLAYAVALPLTGVLRLGDVRRWRDSQPGKVAEVADPAGEVPEIDERDDEPEDPDPREMGGPQTPLPGERRDVGRPAGDEHAQTRPSDGPRP
jgi:O-antigen/teichoic acid export membrane protein